MDFIMVDTYEEMIAGVKISIDSCHDDIINGTAYLVNDLKGVIDNYYNTFRNYLSETDQSLISKLGAVSEAYPEYTAQTLDEVTAYAQQVACDFVSHINHEVVINGSDYITGLLQEVITDYNLPCGNHPVCDITSTMVDDYVSTDVDVI